MSSVKLSRVLATLATSAALFALAGPAAAETLVVRASGPSAGGFSAGKKLPDGGSVTLKAGDVLTLLDGQGTRTLRGPGVFGTTAPSTGGSPSRIAAFLARSTSYARTGAVRGVPTKPRSPRLWYVDSTRSTTMCIADPANVKLWRPVTPKSEGTPEPTPLTLTLAGKDGKGTVTFAAEQSVADWPAALPVTEGATYQVTGANPVTLRFTILSTADGLEGTASTLIARKCDAQIDLLIETVAVPDPAPDGPG